MKCFPLSFSKAFIISTFFSEEKSNCYSEVPAKFYFLHLSDNCALTWLRRGALLEAAVGCADVLHRERSFEAQHCVYMPKERSELG